MSSLDFNNGITLEGFRIPALTDAPGRDRRRAARRAVVRDCGPAQQHHPGRQGRDSDPQQAADHRRPVQEQVGAGRADRADGADHAAAGAAARSRRSAAAADAAEVLPPAPDRRRGRATAPDRRRAAVRAAGTRRQPLGPWALAHVPRHDLQPRRPPRRQTRHAGREPAFRLKSVRRPSPREGRGARARRGCDDGAAGLLGADD